MPLSKQQAPTSKTTIETIKTMAMETQQQPNVPELTKEAQDEAKQIDAIAEKEGWFRGDPDGPIYPTVEAYMRGSLDLNTTVEKLAVPIEEQFSSADGGKAIRKAEEDAAYQRKLYSADKAEELWGVPLREDELPPETNSGTATTEGLLWDLWYSILHTAKRTPWKNAAAQNRLLDLVRALKARPDPPLPTQMTKPLEKDWIWSSGDIWSNLVMNGPATRECWNDSLRGDKAHSPAEIHAWTNINAFVAAITKEGLADFWLYAIWAMRDALEDEYKGKLAKFTLDAEMPAAAVWIMVLAEKLWEREEVWESSETKGDPAGGGKLWKGKSGFCKERWAFWKGRFQLLSQRKALRDETREMATEAFEKMESIEKATV